MTRENVIGIDQGIYHLLHLRMVDIEMMTMDGTTGAAEAEEAEAEEGWKIGIDVHLPLDGKTNTVSQPSTAHPTV